MSASAISKRALAVFLAIAVVLGIVLGIVITSDRADDDGAASPNSGPDTPSAVAIAADPVDAIIDPSSPEGAALGVSQALFAAAPVVIVTSEDSWEVASWAAALGVPVLVADVAGAVGTESGTGQNTVSNAAVTTSTQDGAETDPAALSPQLQAELERLGTREVLSDGVPAEVFGGGDVDLDVHDLSSAGPELAVQLGLTLTTAPVPEDAASALGGLGTTVYTEAAEDLADVGVKSAEVKAAVIDAGASVAGSYAPAERSTGAVVVTDGTHRAAVGSAVAAGARAQLSDLDPRASAKAIDALADAEAAIAVFGEENPDLGWQLATARTGTHLPGGGQLVFDGKRYIALYGSPHTTTLGVLGEQGVPETVARAEEHAAPYRELTDDMVVPALEIIVTVASGAPGDDGNYSNEWAIDGFIPLIEAAQEAGQYVVIDFQPGRSDFLTQVQMYEPLLEYPHVGVALDPEWRLGPDEMPLTRIGHVEIDEVNAVVNYLADFTRDRNLPQKMLILHQFQVQMLRDIDQLDQSRPELAILIHVDGQGSQSAKQDTWRTLLNNAPHVEYWGWKNFYDEDIPMLDPAATYEVEPLPEFVSYQ